MGTFSIQHAKSIGTEVTGVCTTKNFELARSIGADQIVDYGQENLAQTGQRYDLITDTVRKRSFSDCWRMYKSLIPERLQFRL